MERKIVANRLQTPDGTIIQSHHRHDYVTYTDKNGKEYMVDGGTDYLRYNVNGDEKLLTTYSDDPWEVQRTVICRGGRGKDGTESLKWVPLDQMSNSWLDAVIDYNIDRGATSYKANQHYALELAYREKHGIIIEDETTD